jgi:predicted Zn-dependent protease
MQLPDSYEAMLDRAIDSIDVRDTTPAIQQFERLTNRLLSLSPALRARQPSRQNILVEAAGRWMVLLRWDGQTQEALKQIQRLRQAIPEMGTLLELEEALDLIDAGQANKGLDILRANLMRDTAHRQQARVALARELWGTGSAEEAEILLNSALKSAYDIGEAAEAADVLIYIEAERNDPDAILATWRQLASKGSERPEWTLVYELLAALHAWDHLAEALQGEKDRPLRQVFEAEATRTRGERTKAEETWRSALAGASESGIAGYVQSAALVMLGEPEEAIPSLMYTYLHQPMLTNLLLLLVAALAETGHMDDARQFLQTGLKNTRSLRPRWDAFPRPYWLLLRRFPLDDSVFEALKPYFAAGSE